MLRQSGFSEKTGDLFPSGFECIIRRDLRNPLEEGSRNLLCRGRNLDKEELLIRLCI